MTNWYKNKTKINLVIDAVMLILLMAIAGLGFLIKYVLIPGYKRNALYKYDVELYFMELTRHEWGSIHLCLSFVFLAFMILHIILHWKMIICIFRQMVTGKASRISFGCPESNKNGSIQHDEVVIVFHLKQPNSLLMQYNLQCVFIKNHFRF